MITRLRAAAAALTAACLLSTGVPAMAHQSTPAVAPERVVAPLPMDSALVVRYGETSTKVRDIQNRLLFLGYLDFQHVSGQFLSPTHAAIKAFQQAYKRPITGYLTGDDYYVLWSKTYYESYRAKPFQRTTYVKDAQIRLTYLGFLAPGEVNSYYGKSTWAAVRAWQQSVGRRVTGTLTSADFSVLYAQHRSGVSRVTSLPVRVRPGNKSATVVDLQNRLIRLGLLAAGSNDGYYGTSTTAAVKKWQARNYLPQTGIFYEAHYIYLYRQAMAVKVPSGPSIDARCRTGARVICVNRGGRKLYYVTNGTIQRTYDIRTGRKGMETRPGQFKVYYMNANHVSNLYYVKMPYSIFFDGGIAVHYSADFAANGYGIGSHGCVNLRDWNGAAWLFSQVRLGDKVVVYN